ncbi:MAG: hypothetical protein JW888_14595 [Pirellulales bacterium]|nr:hypothetical protein [Pirellulales bacterium]
MHSRDHVSPDRATENPLASVAPADQPNTVHEMAERLLPAYTVEGGTVHLAGCLLEERLFLRAASRDANQSVEFYLDSQGREVNPATVAALGMDHTVELERPPEHAEKAIRRLSSLARQMLAQRFAKRDMSRPVELTAVWCKFAEGKLRFLIGENTADLPFADWARTLRPPPFVCPYSHQTTYRVTATDDGRIVAAEQVATCDASSRRVLSGDLVTCAVTGQRVLPEFVEMCPVTGETVLRTEMVPCGMCRQKVAPTSLRQTRCEACNRLEPVSKADPRLARLLDEHPLLDRWRRWCLSESATAYHLTARGWFRELLLVVDKDSLNLKLLATSHRFRSGWDVVEPSHYDFVLRG